MRNISKGLAFKYHYKGEASIEEEFQPARDGVDYVTATFAYRGHDEVDDEWNWIRQNFQNSINMLCAV